MHTNVAALLTPQVGVEEIDATRAKITLDPLERGFGHTLGNALRRVLLSSIVGSAITRAEFDSGSGERGQLVANEYDRLPGVVEDLIDVMLNLKGVAIRMDGINEVELVLQVTGPGEVRAGDIQLVQNVSVANPDWHIAHIDDDSTFSARLIVHRGRGYVPASMLDPEEKQRAIGSLCLDASFSPVRHVAYDVQSARVERRTDMDKLILDVETNGTIAPYEALCEAGRVLCRQLLTFAELNDEEVEVAPSASDAESVTSMSDMPVTELELSARVVKCLLEQDIERLDQLVACTPSHLLKTPNLGKQALSEIQACLKERGLSLGMSVDVAGDDA